MKVFKSILSFRRQPMPTEFPRPCCLCKVGEVDICNCGCAANGNTIYVCNNCNGSEESILGLMQGSDYDESRDTGFYGQW